MNDIFQIYIEIAGSKPTIWRRVLIHKNSTFSDLHHVIQFAMNWEFSHMYEFKVGKKVIGDIDGLSEVYDEDILLDYQETTLESQLKLKQKFSYIYDFGDNWDHLLKVEKSLPIDPDLQYPVCVGGELSGPPENVGGIYGYYDFLEIIADENHPEREDMLEWIGGEFDPKAFHLEQVNQALKQWAHPTKSIKRKKG